MQYWDVMGQDTTLVRASPLAGPTRRWLAALAFASLLGCHEEAEPRAIRAHETLRGGVAHAEPSLGAERYCSSCHGVGLQGGIAAEPSCYQCHGKTWLDDGNVSRAPADHAVINKEFRHQAGLFTPEASCGACHGGEALEGETSGGLSVPGCQLCHTKLWEERTPP